MQLSQPAGLNQDPALLGRFTQLNMQHNSNSCGPSHTCASPVHQHQAPDHQAVLHDAADDCGQQGEYYSVFPVLGINVTSTFAEYGRNTLRC